VECYDILGLVYFCDIQGNKKKGLCPRIAFPLHNPSVYMTLTLFWRNTRLIYEVINKNKRGESKNKNTSSGFKVVKFLNALHEWISIGTSHATASALPLFDSDVKSLKKGIDFTRIHFESHENCILLQQTLVDIPNKLKKCVHILSLSTLVQLKFITEE
jgi:hypothetical protein